MIISFIGKIGYFVSYFFSYNLSQGISRLFVNLYTGWISRNFGFCGKNCRFGFFRILVGAKYVSFGDSMSVGRGCTIEVYDTYMEEQFHPSLIWGNNCRLGDDSHLSCINGIIVGNGVRCGRKVFITDNAHGTSDRSVLDTQPNLRPLYSKGKVIIEDNVWIGEMSCIMPGVRIGYGSIIGASSVVTHDVPPYSVVAGNPARVIKSL